MPDVFSTAKRSEVMSHIRGKDTKPERIVRTILHKLGYRFRLHDHRLPGKPDIVLKRYRTVVFVHGCFWHRHGGCRLAYTPKTRREFWLGKLESNVKRDARVKMQLQKLGWTVIVVWECDLDSPQKLATRLDHQLQARLVKLQLT